MKESITRVLLALVVVAAALMVGPITKSQPAVALAQTNGCQLATLSGPYAFSFSGYVNTGPKAFTPLAAAGTISFQPEGTLKRNFSGSFGGSLFTVPDSGSYSLNEDCTFTANLPQVGETWNLIPADRGEQIEFFINTAGRVGAGTLTHQ